MLELWGAYCRLWGRAEKACRRVRYQPPEKMEDGRYAGLYDSVLDEIWILREVAPPHEPHCADLLLEEELLVLAHELAHVQNRREDDRRWMRYYAALNRWHTLRKLPEPVVLSPEWGRLILEEEELAEQRGEMIVREVYPPAADAFRDRAERSLRHYRNELGLA